MNWLVVAVPLVLYFIFVVLMVVGFVFMARYRNCHVYRIKNPTCFTDWKCSESDDTSPYERFVAQQKKCGTAAMINAVKGASTQGAKTCAVYNKLKECKSTWQTGATGVVANITTFMQQAEDQCENSS